MGEASTKILLTAVSAAVAEAETATFSIDITKTRFNSMRRLLLLPPFGWLYLKFGVKGKLRVSTGGFHPRSSAICFTPRYGLSGTSTSGTPLGIRCLVRPWLGEHLGCLLRVQIVASPADLIKVRMQADSRLHQGLQPRYSGIFDAFEKIIRTEGFLGLWKGVFPNAQRAVLVNMGELACYDQAKQFIVNHQICGDNAYAHTLASVASGLSATALSCPADVIKTRMMSQAAGKGELKTIYRSSYDCLVKTVKFEGVIALWKGFLPTWGRLGPWHFVFWVSYEEFRQVSGLSSF